MVELCLLGARDARGTGDRTVKGTKVRGDLVPESRQALFPLAGGVELKVQVPTDISGDRVKGREGALEGRQGVSLLPRWQVYGDQADPLVATAGLHHEGVAGDEDSGTAVSEVTWEEDGNPTRGTTIGPDSRWSCVQGTIREERRPMPDVGSTPMRFL